MKKYNIDKKILNLVLSAPELNQEKVLFLKKAIQNGTYIICIDRIVEAILKAFLKYNRIY